MNNSNKNLLLPSQAREAKIINTQKLIFNHKPIRMKNTVFLLKESDSN